MFYQVHHSAHFFVWFCFRFCQFHLVIFLPGFCKYLKFWDMDVKQSSELGVIHHYRLRPQDKKKNLYTTHLQSAH